MKDINSKIATLILRAQNASDGGKNIDCLVCGGRTYRDNCAGYGNKDVMVIEAIKLITANKSYFKFAVTSGGSVSPYLVYFETRIMGEKLQVSFHSFDRRLWKYQERSFRIKWDHKDSRESALKIYWYYVPNGEYGDS